MKAFKLVRQMKNGELKPLFIGKKEPFVINEWMEAKEIPTKGFKTRKGFHCCFTPHAPHLSEKDRVWVEVEVDDWQKYDRPESQGGAWILANRMKILTMFNDTK